MPTGAHVKAKAKALHKPSRKPLKGPRKRTILLKTIQAKTKPRLFSTSSYIRHILRYPIRPIQSDRDLDRAIALLDKLIDKGRRISPLVRFYKMALADLIEHYENRHEPVTKVSPADMLRHLLDARCVSQAKFAADTGISEASVSEILSGKRPVSPKNRLRFSEYLKVDPTVFA